MATKIQIYNAALRLLSIARITSAEQTAESNEQARVLNDLYEMVRDEVLASHPWNFAIKRATLTELGGEITTWTATAGLTNVWQAALTTEPASVKFDGTEGTEESSAAGCDAEYEWYWASNVLYVYSTADPTTIYTSSGVEAIIPEFEFTKAYALPTNCLRVIRMEEDNAVFVKEGNRLLTDEDEAKIQYIAQITDEAEFSPAFVTAFAQRLAAEAAYSLTNSATVAETTYKLYIAKKREAKGIDAQEGTAKRLEELPWETARE